MKPLWISLLATFLMVAPQQGLEESAAKTAAENTGTVTIKFYGIEPGKGLLRSALYGKEGFLKRDGELYDSKYKADSETMTVVYEDIPYGTYAIAAYQDKDENAKISKSMIGLPNEAYGFSKPLKTKWRVPKFEEVSFELDAPREDFEVTIKYWRHH